MATLPTPFFTGGGTFVPAEELANHIAALKAAGKHVVLTNGVFDILHPGHLALMASASALGDVLVVALNSDASTRRLKGPTRPVNNQEVRAQMLSGLRWVDFVTLFEEDTADNIITTLKPSVVVKGGDYTEATFPEADSAHAVGAAIEFVKIELPHSTSDLIKTVQNKPAEDASNRAASVVTHKK